MLTENNNKDTFSCFHRDIVSNVTVLYQQTASNITVLSVYFAGNAGDPLCVQNYHPILGIWIF